MIEGLDFYIRRETMFGKKKIQELESRLYEADDNVSRLTREKEELEQELTHTTSRLSEAEKSLLDANARLSELENTQSELEAAVTDLDYQLKTEKAENSEVERKLSDAKSDHASLQERLNASDSRVAELQESISSADSDIADLEQSIAAARADISDLKAKFTDAELEDLKERTRVTQVEIERLKGVYAKKLQDFDESVEKRKEIIEKENALQRFNLEKEIEDDRQANREYVSSTVREFNDSFNYYLNQIRMLSDALGDVAARTGETLFQEKDQEMLTSMGESVIEKIHGEVDAVDPEGIVLIKSEKGEIHPRPAASQPSEKGSAPCKKEEIPCEPETSPEPPLPPSEEKRSEPVRKEKTLTPEEGSKGENLLWSLLSRLLRK